MSQRSPNKSSLLLLQRNELKAKQTFGSQARGRQYLTSRVRNLQDFQVVCALLVREIIQAAPTPTQVLQWTQHVAYALRCKVHVATSPTSHRVLLAYPALLLVPSPGRWPTSSLQIQES
jgi:hypothetical protein